LYQNCQWISIFGGITMKRKLGKYDKQVSAMGMGCWAIGGPFRNLEGRYFAYGKVDDAESIRTVRRAFDLGINFFDTADVYGTGHSEIILGKALEEHRDDVVIATKFSSVFEEGTRITAGRRDTSPEHIHQAIEGSFQRLQTDFIALYQLHAYDLDSSDAVIVRDTLEDLATEGRIGGYGWSTDDSDRAQVFAEGKHCIAMQYVLTMLLSNARMIELCETHSLASVIRGPFAYGLLTGKYNANSKVAENHLLHSSNFADERHTKIFAAIDNLREILVEDGRTLAQAALGYIWAQTETAVPIPGAKTVAQIEENAKAMEFGPLSSDSVKQVEEVFSEVRRDFTGY
jgi:aryl-alcohol dehydrogenase-like predicted oxidoreductase